MKTTRALGLIACGLIGLCCVRAAGAELAVAGKLAVDLHAELMVTIDDSGCALNWYNCGALWGTFGDFGFDGPRQRYPKLGKIGGAEAVIFDGNDRLRLDVKAPESITDGDFSVEVWASDADVQGRQTLVSWAGASGAGEPVAVTYDRAAADGRWHHIVLVSARGAWRVFVDGKAASSRAGKPDLAPGGTIVLGADAGDRHGFSGGIAAVRIHEKAMTDAQVAHNHQGGVRLGADLLPNIAARPRGILFADNSKDPNIACRTSKHFRTCWEKNKDVKGVMAERVPRQLADAERYYEIYTKKLGMHLPIVSDKIANRGDGRKYLIEICNNWKGGNFGGHMPHGFGYPIQGPGFLSGHELAHACQMHCMGCFPGNWWEAHANWMPEQAGRPHVHPGLNNLTSMFFMGNGRHYYHCWLIFQHLAETPEYGPLFVARMWHHFKRDERGRPRYLWALFHTIDPDPATPLADEIIKMARRNVTWDYRDHDRYVKANENPDMARYGRTLLEPVPCQPGWHRVPREMAPQQFGYNICPLKPAARTVTVDLQGYVNPQRGSDWRACLVAVNKAGKPRYGAIFSTGKSSLTLKDDEGELYLVVAAAPSRIMDVPMTGDYRSPPQHQFPYKVALQGAEPRDVLAARKPDVPGRAHPNGGGFVAATATVSREAYVGRGARVLDRAKVLGHARVEGFAVVRGKAVVQDHAIVSGHALVEGEAVVRDCARVRDFAKISSRNIVKDSAKVLEHGSVSARGKEISGYAVVKGMAAVRGNVGGSAMLDGSYSKSNDLTRGVWFTWNWSAGKNPGELDKDLGGLYAEYTFDTDHPYLAWDTHGATHGYLVGGPKVVREGKRTALALNGEDQYVELHKDVADMRDITLDAELRWDGGAKGQRVFELAADARDCMSLTPSDADGKLRFAIRKDGKEQVLGGKAPLPTGKWTRVQVMLCEDTGRLYVDGRLVDRNDRITLNPEDIRATACLLGRGLAGNFFRGRLDRFSIHANSLVDEVPPSPNPAQWAWEPTFVTDSQAVMRAATGTDPRGTVEYLFEETTGQPGGDSSGWQKASVYCDDGLKPGLTYAYRVKMRDVSGNVTGPSAAVSVKWANPRAFVQDSGDNGLVVIEAEHFHHKTAAPDGHEWRPDKGAKGYSGDGAMLSAPDNGTNRVRDYPEQSPRLDYHVRFVKKGRHWLWVRAYAPHYNSDSIHVGLDLRAEAWGQDISTGWGGYKWTRTRPFAAAAPGTHRLSVWMREDGTRVDKIVLTTQADYKPSEELDAFKVPVGAGPPESPQRQGS